MRWTIRHGEPLDYFTRLLRHAGDEVVGWTGQEVMDEIASFSAGREGLAGGCPA